jgi:hypothetical protein
MLPARSCFAVRERSFSFFAPRERFARSAPVSVPSFTWRPVTRVTDVAAAVPVSENTNASVAATLA